MDIQTVSYYRLFLVVHPSGEDGNGEEKTGYFTSLTEANKVAVIKRGSWNTHGTIREVDFQNLYHLPKYFKTALEWAENTLTVKEFKQHNF
jgi:hypothetical protein